MPNRCVAYAGKLGMMQKKVVFILAESTATRCLVLILVDRFLSYPQRDKIAVFV